MASVGSIVGGAFRLFRERPGAVVIWGLVNFAAAIAMALAMSWLLTGRLSIVSNPAAFMPQQPGAAPSGFWQVMLIIYPASLVLSATLMNAVFRAVLRPEESSFASLRLGMDELRTIGLAIVLVIVGAIAMFVSQLLLMLAVAFIGMVAGGGVIGALLGAILVIAFFGAWVWLWVRLSLIFPLTFHRRKISVDAAWDLSRGRFWTLFGAYLVIVLVMFVVMAALLWSMMGDYFSAMWAARGDPAQMQIAAMRFAQRQMEMPVATRIVQMFLNTLVGIIAFVLAPGVIASATRELLIERGGDLPDDETLQTASETE